MCTQTLIKVRWHLSTALKISDKRNIQMAVVSYGPFDIDILLTVGPLIYSANPKAAHFFQLGNGIAKNAGCLRKKIKNDFFAGYFQNKRFEFGIFESQTWHKHHRHLAQHENPNNLSILNFFLHESAVKLVLI